MMISTLLFITNAFSWIKNNWKMALGVVASGAIAVFYAVAKRRGREEARQEIDDFNENFYTDYVKELTDANINHPRTKRDLADRVRNGL